MVELVMIIIIITIIVSVTISSLQSSSGSVLVKSFTRIQVTSWIDNVSCSGVYNYDQVESCHHNHYYFIIIIYKVCQSFPETLKGFPGELQLMLKQQADVFHPDIRMVTNIACFSVSFCRALNQCLSGTDYLYSFQCWFRSIMSTSIGV